MTEPNVYRPGTLVPLDFNPVDGNGDPFDPTKVRYHYKDSQGNETVKTYPDDADVTRVAEGQYRLGALVPYTNDSAGEWPYDAQALNSDGEVIYTMDSFFMVKRLDGLDG